MGLVSPSRTVTIGTKDYLLDGSFGTLRNVQEHFKADIVRVLIAIMDMRLDEIAGLIAIGSGGKADDIGQEIVDSIGVMTREYSALKTQLVAWLNVAIAPKDAREKKSAEMETIIQSSSRGPTTSDSPSAPSDGSPASSVQQRLGADLRLGRLCPQQGRSLG